MNKWILGTLTLLLSYCSVGAEENLTDEQSAVKSLIQEAAYCSTDSDCIIIGDYCPIGCNIVVNKNEAEEVKDALENVHSNCEYDCINTELPPRCVNSVCSVVHAH